MVKRPLLQAANNAFNLFGSHWRESGLIESAWPGLAWPGQRQATEPLSHMRGAGSRGLDRPAGPLSATHT